MANGNRQFGKFSENAKHALISAQKAARYMGASHLGTEHILLGILSVAESLGYNILANFGITLEKVHLILNFSKYQGEHEVTQEGLSVAAQKSIEGAVTEAAKRGHTRVGTEHLLLSLLESPNNIAYHIISTLKVDPNNIRRQLISLLSAPAGPTEPKVTVTNQPGKVNPFARGQEASALEQYSVDITSLAKNGKIDPVVGRDKEIARVIQILNRRTKNNPVLIGEPGIGKTAIVEGLALRIIDHEVPDALIGKKIMALSPSAMVAGTKYRGEFEDRINQIIAEVKADPEIMLFVDEMHTIMGAGSAEGSLDAANILKPALARGDLQMIGATTLDEYRKNIEKDAALERRFQPIIVAEPSAEESIGILLGIKSKYEDHHKVSITKEAVEEAVKLSKRYIQDRYLPDKAIDLIDEAASAKNIASGGKEQNDKLKDEQNKLDEIIRQKERAVLDQNFRQATKLREEEEGLVEKIEKIKSEQVTPDRSKWPKITHEDIVKIISDQTGVPIGSIKGKEASELMNIEAELTKRVVGQEEAIKAIASSIRRSRLNIGSPDRPFGSFIFLGPTGVGKTELAKQLAEVVFHDKKALVRIDMSEFMEKHNVSRLVGAPAGYIGFEEGGKLTEAVRRQPYSVVLFDEIEKAHPDTLNILLQILEDGFLTDAKGRQISFKNTIIIMTSNIGSHLFNEEAKVGFNAETTKEQKASMERFKEVEDGVLKDLKGKLRPEFLNRVDKVIVFRPLTLESIKEIAKRELARLQERLQDERKIKLSVGRGVYDLLASEGFDPDNGARPLRRLIANFIEDPLAEGLLTEEFKDRKNIKLKKEKNKLVLN